MAEALPTKKDLVDLFEHFVYVLKCPETGEVRYVGVTQNPRKRIKNHIRDARYLRCHRETWIHSLTQRGLEPVMEVIDRTKDWDASERKWIADFKKQGCRLVNGTDGGRVPNEKAKRQRSTGGIRKHPVLWKFLRTMGQSARWLKLNSSAEKAARFAFYYDLCSKKIHKIVKSGDKDALKALIAKVSKTSACRA